MCGISGILNLTNYEPEDLQVFEDMLGSIQHRGPDSMGIYRDDDVLMGNVRLSIIDLAGGDQPITNEDGTLWIVFNGEIYNYPELRQDLQRSGHQFTTQTDTEVLLHLYEEKGPQALQELNGQFAIAIWDVKKKELFLARDRMGIRPLFYTVAGGKLIFSSEIKSILAHPLVEAQINSRSLRQVFTYWSVQTPSTIFKNIQELPPANYALIRGGQISMSPYWALDFTPFPHEVDEEETLQAFEELLIDSCRLRLRADVPVGAYLSGGLDSSVTTSIIHKYFNNQLSTFSISFSDPQFDESQFQAQMGSYTGRRHQQVYCQHEDIARVFPDVIWHTETPILRTAPAPMYLLSRLVNENDFKVVLTGEGADEILAGYDIFKEMKVRRFWAKNPDSKFRPKLFRLLYPDISNLNNVNSTYLAAFFKKGLLETDSPFYSHQIRWSNTSRLHRFLAEPFADEANFLSPQLHQQADSLDDWPSMGQAQYLEMKTFLSPYLLSSQGDRMAMANSVEGRLPFLDHRLIEFCGQLPPHVKMRALTEKWLLKKLGRGLVPPSIWQRVKRPYRAPIQQSFVGDHAPEYVQDMLSEKKLKERGYFKSEMVTRLQRKANSGRELSQVENMALVGVLSTQLVHELFCEQGHGKAAAVHFPLRKIVDRTEGRK